MVVGPRPLSPPERQTDRYRLGDDDDGDDGEDGGDDGGPEGPTGTTGRRATRACRRRVSLG
jgi:hypothetical protein